MTFSWSYPMSCRQFLSFAPPVIYVTLQKYLLLDFLWSKLLIWELYVWVLLFIEIIIYLQFRVCLLDMLVFQYRILVFTLCLSRRQTFLLWRDTGRYMWPSRVLFVSAFSFSKLDLPKSCHWVSSFYTLPSSLAKVQSDTCMW